MGLDLAYGWLPLSVVIVSFPAESDIPCIMSCTEFYPRIWRHFQRQSLPLRLDVDAGLPQQASLIDLPTAVCIV